MQSSKACTKCKQEKAISEFYRHWRTEDKAFRMDSICKSCSNEKSKQYEHSIVGRQKRVNSLLKRKYGITVEDWDEFFRIQGGRCGICGKHFSSDSRFIHTDHDHQTQKVRGLLCLSCNTKLDWYLENQEAIEDWANKDIAEPVLVV